MLMVLFLVLFLVLIAILLFRPKETKQETQNLNKLNSELLPSVQAKYYEEKSESKPVIDEENSSTQQEPKVEERDAYERDFSFEIGQEYRIEFELEIDYTDRKGLFTTRQIRVNGYRVSPKKEDAEIWGYCYLRNAGRTFYASRIGRCVDLDTGEVITDIIPFLENKYYTSPIGQLDLWMERRKGEMDVLVYVGRLDNQLRQNKKDIIIDYIIKKEPDLTITTETINNYLKNCGKVSKVMFGRLLTQLSTAEENVKEDLIEFCSKIIETKKNKNTEEEKVIGHMRKRLFPKEKR